MVLFKTKFTCKRRFRTANTYCCLEELDSSNMGRDFHTRENTNHISFESVGGF